MSIVGNSVYDGRNRVEGQLETELSEMQIAEGALTAASGQLEK